MDLHKFAKPFRIDDGKKFRLKDISPTDTRGIKSKARALEMLQQGVDRLRELQDRLYAQDCWSVLLIFQAMDAAGKDGTIKHVMSGINPQGCQVFSFKAPSNEELDHDYLWRAVRALPERGRIGIFNRSYYEEVLVVKVHEEILNAQKLPPPLITKDVWRERYEDIAQVRALSHAQRRHHPQVLSPRLEGGAAPALSDPPARVGQELEVLDGRREGAELLGRVSGGLRGRHPSHGVRARALVRRASRSQMVHADGRVGRSRRRTRRARSDLSCRRRAQARRIEAGADGAGEGRTGERKRRRRRGRRKRSSRARL